MPETEVYIGLGSNLGKREDFLKSALDKIRTNPDMTLEKVSPAYESEPLGFQDQGPFLNMAAKIRTSLAADELFAKLNQIENEVGKKAQFKNGPREIDIDILVYGDDEIQSDDLNVPHSGLKSREFALRPLVDIAPDLTDPSTGKSYSYYLEQIAGRKDVRERRDLNLMITG